MAKFKIERHPTLTERKGIKAAAEAAAKTWGWKVTEALTYMQSTINRTVKDEAKKEYQIWLLGFIKRSYI